MIKGQHTALRAIEREDLPSLLSWRNDPDLRKYFREYRELNFQQQRKNRKKSKKQTNRPKK